MIETKTCKQCGEIKPLEQFRPYYKGKGHYTICKDCESINTRYKYLNSKGYLTKLEQEELTKITELYEFQASIGLKPPLSKAHKWGAVSERLDSLLSKYSAKYIEIQSVAKGLVPDGVVIPYELSRWLVEPLDKLPEYYDDIYDELVKTYRPLLHVKNETFEPLYDLTYAKVLGKILERFNEYGDNYDYDAAE